MNALTHYLAHGDAEITKQLEGMALARGHAAVMLADGKITKAEMQDFEAMLLSEAMKAMPMEDYAAMRKDGRWEKLEKLTAHDGKRAVYDVGVDRGNVAKKVIRDALNELWIGGHMDDDTFKLESQKLGMPDDLKMAVTDKDENAAIDTFVLNNGGDEEYAGYRDEVKKVWEGQSRDGHGRFEPDESLEVSADDVREFQTRHNIEPAEAPSEQSEAAPAASADASEAV